MSDWAGIKKAINSNLNKPLNTLIEESRDTVITDYLGNSTYGLSALKTLINKNSDKFDYSNVSCGSYTVITDYKTIQGKGKVTFIAVEDTYFNLIIDGVNIGFSQDIYLAHKESLTFTFEKSIAFKPRSTSYRVWYIIQLVN